MLVLLLPAVAALAVGLLLRYAWPRSQSSSVAPRLAGSWFVRYRSDPRAYLDVALEESPPGVVVARVTADLRGPQATYRDLQLAYNPGDREWQLICWFLPARLTGGVWWVSRVRITTAHGQWADYSARSPHATYHLSTGRGGAQASPAVKTRVWIGSFYATEEQPSRPLYHIQTFPIRGGGRSNPVLQVYRRADPVRWIAVNDDPDVNQDHAHITMPLVPGHSYYIRVDDRYGQRGDYAVLISRSPVTPPVLAPGPDPDPFEPDDHHHQARPLAVGQVQVRSFSRRSDTIWGDQDWMLFHVPGSAQRNPRALRVQ